MDVNAESTFDPKTDLRATFPRFSAMVMKNNQPIIELLTTLGATKGVVAAWMQGGWRRLGKMRTDSRNHACG